MTIVKAAAGVAALTSILLIVTACGGGSGSRDRSPQETPTPQSPSPPTTPAPPPVTPEVPTTPSAIAIFGINEAQGFFDAAPTVDANGTIWMSYTHVSEADSGKRLIETRLATTADAGLNWQDAGVTINSATALQLPPPNIVNAVAHEVSRLIYNPYAAAAGADPWLMLWHRYPGVLLGEDKNLQLLQDGWVALKSAQTPTTLGDERKMFTGAAYNITNDDDAFGPPAYRLNALYEQQMGDCQLFTEPGILAKREGVYVALFCAGSIQSSKIVLLRCNHDMTGCDYRGDLINGDEARSISTTYSAFSAPELVSVNNQDFLIVSPVSIDDDLYRGCIAYLITDLANAKIQRIENSAVGKTIASEQGDFNGACGYIAELTGSGIIMGEAFFGDSLLFGLFATDERL